MARTKGTNNAQKIRTMTGEGKSAEDISKELGVTNAYVHQIRSAAKRALKTKKKVSVLFPAEQTEQQKIDNLMIEIQKLQTVVDYLERRNGRA